MRFRSGPWLFVACACVSACAGKNKVPPAPPAPAPAPTGSVEEQERTEPTQPTPAPSAPPRAAAGPCVDELSKCTLDGCAAPGTPHALLNHLKRTTTTEDGSSIAFASATPIKVAHMKRLQKEAENVLPQRDNRELDAEDRKKLTKFDLGDCVVGEGSAVRVAGYVAPSGHSRSAGAHLGAEESVNCGLGGSANVDFHIPITAAAHGEDECHGVVVEMIPQGRPDHPGWTLEALHDLATKRRLVLVVGRLFYDNEHLVRATCSGPPLDQPKRASLWEVHPIVEFYVCKDAACSAASAKGWQKID